MTAPTEIRKRAMSDDKTRSVYALVEQLPGESLTKAVEFLEALSNEASEVRESIPAEPQEKALLQIIQRRL